MIITGLG